MDNLSNHWPVFYTMLITYFYKFGELIGNHNLGIFLFSIIQTVFYALIFSYVIYFLKKIGANDLIVVSSFLFYAFNPVVCAHNGSLLKDANYASIFVLILVLLLDYLCNRDYFMKSKLKVIILIVSSILLSLLRKNGIYIIAPTMVVLIIYELKKYKINKNILIFVIAIVLSLFSIKAIDYLYSPEKGSIAEALSLPIQQTSRMIKYHEELITDDEKNIINQVLPYDNIASLYDERISDPVKSEFNKNASFNQIMDYLRVWMQGFFKAPMTYLNATLRQNIYMIYPGVNDYRYHIECNNYQATNQDEGLFQTPLSIKNIQHYYERILYVLSDTPILGYLTNIATYHIIFVFIVLILFNKSDRYKLLMLVPCLFSILICIAGPAIYANTRYTYPIVWSTPILLGLINYKRENNINM